MQERIRFETEVSDLGLYEVMQNKTPASSGVAQKQPRDVVDDYLHSRKSLYKVRFVGMNIHVTLPRSKWTEDYTNRALTEGAIGAAVSNVYMGGATSEQIRNAYEKVVGRGVTYEAAEQKLQGKGALHWTIIDESALTAFANALNLRPKYMKDQWRFKYYQAKMIKFALDWAKGEFAALSAHFTAPHLAASKIDAELIRYLLENKVQSLIEVAKGHSSTSSWREAYERTLDLQFGERPPDLKDFGNVSLAQWAKAIVSLASATRDLLKKQFLQALEQDRKHHLNEHLRPHELKVDNAAIFIVENFEPTHSERLSPLQSIVHGGQRLNNIKGEPIFLLRVESGRVVYQHLRDRKFYEQTLDGFSQEQLYSIYAAAGEKSKGAIALSKWVISLAGAVFPPVRYGLLATDVANTAFRLQANREELERDYDGFMVAYRNIDALLPGVIPKIWDAVLDKENAALFNPLKHVDAGAWIKAIIRVAMLRAAKVWKADLLKMENMTWGRVKGAWASIEGGMGALRDIIKHIIVLVPPIAGSTGVSGQRALNLAQQKLGKLGVADAAAVVARIKGLSKAELERLSREVQDLIDKGTRLLGVLEKCLSW